MVFRLSSRLTKIYAVGFNVVGRNSDYSLFNPGLATYETSDQFDHNASVGFIKIFSYSITNQAQNQLIRALPHQL
ncbi:argininosuccinate synthase [Paenibacillus sp. F411]|uniref:argininosuccinate synthase domain-containing protein n=1 Tax=Paenibacillus sp. F411 TaxID=2820239 RepID=UPI001AAF66C7|nr:argininosuccinate synthase domain-containing protein [Paenibacillus sp. F411]MBO2942625.1 argininosuccinate synthase [Paenibacillus sp. F411]